MDQYALALRYSTLYPNFAMTMKIHTACEETLTMHRLPRMDDWPNQTTMNAGVVHYSQAHSLHIW